jgi:riboflavin synthase
MFSGIVEKLVSVQAITSKPGKTTSIKLKLGRSRVRVGDSVCVNGVCLTVSSKRGDVIAFDVMEETLQVTNLGELSKGSRVNVEKSLRLMDVIGGHFVTGHIDGTGRIIETEKLADGSVKTTIETSKQLTATMIRKGSVAVDGISLTLVDVLEGKFSICLIPHTLSVTTLGYKKVGDTVNIEADMLGKYVRAAVEGMKPD